MEIWITFSDSAGGVYLVVALEGGVLGAGLLGLG